MYISRSGFGPGDCRQRGVPFVRDQGGGTAGYSRRKLWSLCQRLSKPGADVDSLCRRVPGAVEGSGFRVYTPHF